MLGQVLHHCQRIGYMSLDTECQCLQALQKEPCIKRCEASALVTKHDGTDVGGNDGRCCVLREAYAVIGFVRLHQPGPLVSLGGPVKLARIYNDAAQGCAVSADELGCGMHNDICTVLDRSDQIRCSEGIVDDQRQSVLMCHICPCLNVSHFTVRVAQRLNVERLGIRLNGCLCTGQICGLHEGGGHAGIREGMCQEVVGTTVDVLGRYDMITGMSNSLECISDSCSTGADSHSCDTALQSGYSLFEHIHCGIGESSVNVAGILQCESGLSVIGIVEDEGRCLINRNRSCAGCRIRLFLSYMKCLCIESQISLCVCLLSHFFVLLILC